MPWCPKCKNEYRDGFTTCVDCGTELVKELDETNDYEEVIIIENSDIAEKFVQFLSYSEIEAYFEASKENDGFAIYSHAADVKKAKKCFNAFYTVEIENLSQKDSTDKDAVEIEEDDIIQDENTDEEIHDENIEADRMENALQEDELNDKEESESLFHGQSRNVSSNKVLDPDDEVNKIMFGESTAYVKKSEQSKELKSTAATFLVFGFVGLVFTILNIVGVITFFQGPVAFVVMTLMFVGFIYVGFNSISRAKAVAKDALEEEDLTEKINNWLEANITQQVIDDMQDSSLSQEVNFMKTMEKIKEMVTTELGEIDDAYLDTVVEEYYNEHFEE